MKRFILLLLVGTVAACTVTQRKAGHQPPVTADSAMVVSAHPLASETGIAILKSGGNAVDASIATQFALAVVFPAAGNLGGGGFMVHRRADGSVETLDYREKAPGGASAKMFLTESDDVIAGASESTQLASGVPGTVAGLWAAHQRSGNLPWHQLIQPAINLALKGFPLTEKEAKGLNSIQDDLKSNNSVMPEFLIRDRWTAGDTLVLTDLGRTLERIRDRGPSGFYEGETADLIVAEMQRGNGLITYDDLKACKPVWREPVIGRYKQYSIISMAPPSSGGVGLIQLLKSVEPFPIARWGHNAAETIHLLTEAERRVYADRAVYLGDPDFIEVPVNRLLDDGYNAKRMASFEMKKATPSVTLGEAIPGYESEQTTHLSIIDVHGNAVAVTTTLNDSYGSRIVVAGAGFFLNNEMDDFSVKPGHPNMYGAIGGEANKIEPHKRMLSSMTPAILEKDGKLFMVVGTPGGTTIITSVFQVILNVVEHKMNMQEAVAAPRVHHQWLPDEISAERDALSEEVMSNLEMLGHKVVHRGKYGRVDAILVRDDGKLEGGADPRGDDTASGY
jgi:gamma-glutamyltranspeptidase / glutathione hydrolase